MKTKSTKKLLIKGLRPVIEAIRSGKEINKVFFQKGLRGELFNELKMLTQPLDVPIKYVPKERLDRMSNGNHQGVICLLSPIPFQKIENLLPTIFENGETPCILLLDEVSDVRNFGAITRSASCFGVQAIVIPEKGSAEINEDAIKTSAGALSTMPICRSKNLKYTVDFLRKSGLQIVACTEHSSKSIDTIDLTLPVAIIMGAEDKGISKELLKMADDLTRIPIEGPIQSLNVSVAAGVLLYEINRQRN